MTSTVSKLVSKFDEVADRAYRKGYTLMQIKVTEWYELSELLKKMEKTEELPP